MNKANLGWYAFAAIGGLVSGLCFSRSQYYQGRMDEVSEMRKKLEELRDKLINESKREETK